MMDEKKIRKKLTRDCTCPTCGHKTMATECRNCGQLLLDDKGRGRPPKTDRIYKVIDDDGKVVFSGCHNEVKEWLDVTTPLVTYINKGWKPKRKWRIAYGEKGN